MVWGADAPPPTPRYVIGGKVRGPETEAAMSPFQDLAPADRKESARVQVLSPPRDRPGQAVEHGPPAESADTLAADPLFGKASVLQSPTVRDGVPGWMARFDLRQYGGQKYFVGYVPDYKGHVYFLPDRYLRRSANGDYLPTGVDEARMMSEGSNTIKTNDPDFRPWADKATDRVEDLGLSAAIVAVCIAAAWGIRHWRGR